jgi:hypothetical protein
LINSESQWVPMNKMRRYATVLLRSSETDDWVGWLWYGAAYESIIEQRQHYSIVLRAINPPCTIIWT